MIWGSPDKHIFDNIAVRYFKFRCKLYENSIIMMWGRPDTKSVIMFLESLILQQSIIINCNVAATKGPQSALPSPSGPTLWPTTLADIDMIICIRDLPLVAKLQHTKICGPINFV